MFKPFKGLAARLTAKPQDNSVEADGAEPDSPRSLSHMPADFPDWDPDPEHAPKEGLARAVGYDAFGEPPEKTLDDAAETAFLLRAFSHESEPIVAARGGNDFPWPAERFLTEASADDPPTSGDPEWRKVDTDWHFLVHNNRVAKLSPVVDGNSRRWLSEIDPHLPDHGWHAVDFQTLDNGKYAMEQWHQYMARGIAYRPEPTPDTASRGTGPEPASPSTSQPERDGTTDQPHRPSPPVTGGQRVSPELDAKDLSEQLAEFAAEVRSVETDERFLYHDRNQLLEEAGLDAKFQRLAESRPLRGLTELAKARGGADDPYPAERLLDHLAEPDEREMDELFRDFLDEESAPPTVPPPAAEPSAFSTDSGKEKDFLTAAREARKAYLINKYAEQEMADVARAEEPVQQAEEIYQIMDDLEEPSLGMEDPDED